jgi:2-isopropylmalate synthase
MTESREPAVAGTAVRLRRWTVTSGSNTNSRGAVVLGAGDHEWQASAEGNGAVHAMFRAVDRALAEILDGSPRLLAYDVHALAEGPDAEGRVTVAIAPPAGAEGERGTGRYTGESTSSNIIAASVEAYVKALNELLAEAHWADAPAEAGRRRDRAAGIDRRRPDAGGMDTEESGIDTDASRIDTTEWFNR